MGWPGLQMMTCSTSAVWLPVPDVIWSRAAWESGRGEQSTTSSTLRDFQGILAGTRSLTTVIILPPITSLLSRPCKIPILFSILEKGIFWDVCCLDFLLVSAVVCVIFHHPDHLLNADVRLVDGNNFRLLFYQYSQENLCGPVETIDADLCHFPRTQNNQVEGSVSQVKQPTINIK